MTTIKPAPVVKSILVKVPPARAFAVFTADIGKWWPATHSIGGKFKETVLEPRPGGRWYERETDGGECDWGKVIAWEPPSRILLAWQLDHNFKYAADLVTEVEVRFIPESAGATRVELEHRNLERLGEHAERLSAAVSRGWPAILEHFAAATSTA
jgi:uncharacterized protein YndB with AHSA1/START domain